MVWAAVRRALRRPREADFSLARLIMVDVNWFNLDLEAATFDGYGRFLRMLLSGSLDGNGPSIYHDYEGPYRELASRANDVDYDVYRWLREQVPEPPPTPQWKWGEEANDTVRLMVDGLKRCCELKTDDWGSVLAQLNLFGWQIFMDGGRFSDLVGLKDDRRRDYHVCISSRFAFDAALGFLWLVALSTWSAWPWSRRYAPSRSASAATNGDPRAATTWTKPDEELQRLFFERLKGTLQTKLLSMELEGVTRRVLRLGDRQYLPPSFFVAVPRMAAKQAIEYLDREEHEQMVSQLANYLLRAGGPADSVVAESVLQGELLVLRRIVHRFGEPEDQDLPSYLVMPQREVAAEREQMLAMEDKAREVVEVLTSIEDRAASGFFDISSDLDIIENQLRVYTDVAKEGSELWDKLALHLPGAHGKDLDKVHAGIDLLHQTLIQGVADLDQLANELDDREARLAKRVETVRDVFDRGLTERRYPERTCISAALIETGWADRTRSSILTVKGTAARAKVTYDLLLNAIGSAFEERRVRESDVLERGTWRLTWVLGFVAVVSVLQTLVDAPIGTMWDWVSAIFIVFVGGIGAYILVELARTVRRNRRAGWVGSPDFRKQYRSLRRFLADVSTRQLDLFNAAVQREHADDPAARHKAWDRLDSALSKQLAKLWDELFEPEYSERRRLGVTMPAHGAERGERDGESIDQLVRQVESWCLRTLLLTERPRSLWPYGLPRLTCLYRFCSHRLAVPAPTLLGTNVVAFYDYLLSLQNCRFSRANVEQMDRWARGVMRGSDKEQADREAKCARSLYRVLTKDMRLRSEMSPARRQLALEVADPNRRSAGG